MIHRSQFPAFPMATLILLSFCCRTQVVEKDCGYECDSQRDENQELILENTVSKDMPPAIRLHKSPPYIKETLLVIYPLMVISVNKLEGNDLNIWKLWQKLLHNRSIENISLILKHFRFLKFIQKRNYKNQQCNEACSNLPFGQPHDRTHTGDKLRTS